MRYRIPLASVAVVLALAVVGSVAGPGWDPVPMTDGVVVETRETRVAGDGGDPVGTYEVATSVVDVELAGTRVQARISEPIGADGPRPGVVFVHGAGTGRYEDAFVPQAEALASAGVVAMVPNKNLETYSTRDRDYPAMAADYLRSVELLRQLPGVDPDRVGVYGESEGAWVVPVMAADNPSVAFSVLVAAPVVPPRQQAAFAVDSYLRNTGVPGDVLRAIPRVLGMEFPGGGFQYADFNVRPFQQRMRQPVLAVWGTGDAAIPIVQASLALVEDLDLARNDALTIRFYEGADHGIKVDGELVPEFARDLAAWVQGLPESAQEGAQVAGDQPAQRFRADPVARPRWYAEGDLLVAALVGAGVALLVGPVTWAVRRLRGSRSRVLAPGVAGPLTAMAGGAALGFVGLGAYLGVVAQLALNYRTDALVVQGGWLLVRALAIGGAVAGVVLLVRVADGRRAGTPSAAVSRAGEWTIATAVGGSVLLLLLLAYFGVFPGPG